MADPKFIIIGLAQAGKTTFGRILSEVSGLDWMDTSYPVSLIETARQTSLDIKYQPICWDSERNRPNRHHLVATGNALQLLTPTVFVDYVFTNADICVGVRRDSELKAAKLKYPEAVVVYIDRVGHMADPGDNFDISRREADFVYHFRDGAFDAMKYIASVLWRSHGPKGT